MEFKGKISVLWWIVVGIIALIDLGLIVIFAAAPFMTLPGLIAIFILLFIPLGYAAWMIATTKAELRKSSLYIRSGTVEFDIPYVQILDVKEGWSDNTSMCSIAFPRESLTITSTRKRDVTFAVKDKERFLKELELRRSTPVPLKAPSR